MTYYVDCECGFREPTESYERADDMADAHHIMTGHRPVIEEE